MWNRSGRSAALERAQAQLSGKIIGKSDTELILSSEPKGIGDTPAIAGKNKNVAKKKTVPPTRQTPFQGQSDLSSVSSISEHGDGMDLAAAVTMGRWKGDPPSVDGAGGSRFLKKAPPLTAISSQSPTVRRPQTQQPPEPRYVSTSQRSSQSAALSRLAEIEDRIRSRKQGQARDGPTPTQKQVLNVRKTEPSTTPQLQAQESPRSSSDLSMRGKRFLKKKTATVDNLAASMTPQGPDVSSKNTDTAMSLSGFRNAVSPVASYIAGPTTLGSSGREPNGVVGGLSWDSDEEDMRKLLGGSLDSSDDSLRQRGRTIPQKTSEKSFSKSNHTTSPSPPVTGRLLSSSVRALSRSPPSPAHRAAPSRFSSRAPAQRSPSVSARSASVVLTPSPPLSHASPSLPGRLGSPSRILRRSLSSLSARSDVRSLEELFPEALGSLAELFPEAQDSGDAPSECSLASSNDFRINIMSLDDLAPITLGVSAKTTEQKKEPKAPIEAPKAFTPQSLASELKEENEKVVEEGLSYESDFENEIQTERQLSSASEISERLGGDGEESETSEIRAEASDTDRSLGREGSYSASVSDRSQSPSYAARTSDKSKNNRSFSPSRDSPSRSSESPSDWSSSQTVTQSGRSRKRSPLTQAVTAEAAVQTQPDGLAYTWSTGMAALGPAVGMTYVDPTPIASHTVSAEAVEALSAYSPAVFALNDMLRQQLSLTQHFIQTSRYLHSSRVQSLATADYTYTTLEDTKEFIRSHKPPKLTVEEALEEVLQEMREYHYIK